jgi:hypothetical protein
MKPDFETDDKLFAPFPYFGGKRKVADEVWLRLGDVDNYVEPFCGSCAVLLLRPSEPQTETVNDADGLLSNFWRALKERLRRVRVCCGDWTRVCGTSVTFGHGMTGVFLDPPYADTAKRASNLYRVDCEQVAHTVREWAIEQGKNPLMRIALCGYSDEHVMPDNWTVHAWKQGDGYGGQAKERSNNGAKERIWFSPNCIKPSDDLFGKS